VLVGRINTDKLARDRNLLFAEALAAYESGEQWWLAEAEESDQIEEQEKRRSEDPWTEPIRAWIDRTHSASITTDSILGGALDIEIQRREPQHAKRVGAVMRLLGYSRVRRRVGGQRCYVYLPHAEAAALVDE
jgi:predicted P-loop ATPase